MTDPVVDPAPAPAAAEEAVEEFESMTIEEIEASIEAAVTKGVARATPKPAAEDPLAGLDDSVRPFAERTLKLEAELAERKKNESLAAAAQQEAARITEIQSVAKEFKMTKDELIAVADYADAHPEKAAVADFRTLAAMQNPKLLLRGMEPAKPEPKDGAPAGGPAPAVTVEVGSGGDAPPQDFRPGPGHGFGDITNWALSHQRGTFITET
jgi:hypothetical protein